MIFSSYRFLFLFLPAALAGYHALRLWLGMTAAKVWLVAASLVLYGVGQPDFLLGFCALAVGNYLLALALGRCAHFRRLFMGLAVVWNLGALFVFKYLNFFLEGVGLLTGRDFPVIELLLPIGISFFTFQMLAYAADVYRDPGHLDGPLDYAVFISFFPQLIVGPVVKRPELMPQLKGQRLRVFDRQNICRGLMLLSVGCAKKTVLADPLIAFARSFYGGDVSASSWPMAWCGVLAFTFAYYFDFSGYIDMARGIGHRVQPALSLRRPDGQADPGHAGHLSGLRTVARRGLALSGLGPRQRPAGVRGQPDDPAPEVPAQASGRDHDFRGLRSGAGAL